MKNKSLTKVCTIGQPECTDLFGLMPRRFYCRPFSNEYSRDLLAKDCFHREHLSRPQKPIYKTPHTEDSVTSVLGGELIDSEHSGFI